LHFISQSFALALKFNGLVASVQLWLICDFYASANVVAGDIMFPDCSCVRSSVPKHCYHDILSILLTEFHQTFTTSGL